MFMIYYAHCAAYWKYSAFGVQKYFEPVYVNVFFAISGYLLYRKFLSSSIAELPSRKYWGVVRGQVQNILFRLMLPSILFAMIEFVPASILQQRECSVAAFMLKTFGGGTYWFLSAQVVVELFICICLLSRAKSIWFYFGCSCFVTAFGIHLVAMDFTLFSFNASFPWMYQHAMLSAVFFALGGLYWRYEIQINKILDSYLSLLLMIACYACLLSVFPSAFRVTVSTLNLNIPGIGISALGILIFIGICRKLPGIKMIQRIGKSTLGFYLLCGAVPKVLCKVLSRAIPQNTFVGWLVLLISSFALTDILVYNLNRFLPAVFDLRMMKTNQEKSATDSV